MAEFFPSVDAEVGSEVFRCIFKAYRRPDDYIRRNETMPGLGISVDETAPKQFTVVECRKFGSSKNLSNPIRGRKLTRSTTMEAQNKEKITSVPSHPEKDFFISMLTRDIDLQDSILDLLDNCVDGAIRVRSKAMAEKDSFKGFRAVIRFDEDRFVIEDNCGGIPWDIAKGYAFCLGRQAGIPTRPGTIGVVGIGMKRAIFKMGRECHVHSNHKDDAFLVSIPPAWFAQRDWPDFEAKREKPTGQDYGTILEVTELTADARKDFGEGSSFRDTFRDIVAESYSILIEKGFEVTINKKKVEPKPVKLYFESADRPNQKGSLIRPYIYECKQGNVEVFIAVGYRSPLKTQEELEDESKTSFAAKEAGWTIVCNNRVVLSNDRSIKTGWGWGRVPNFHNQFSSIAGIAEFRSPNIADLPITTTKRGVDTGKDIYTLVRQRMQEGLRMFTKNTNRWKGFEGALKARFKNLPTLDILELQEISRRLALSAVRGDGVQKQFNPDLPEKKKVVTTRRISFERELDEIEKVSRFLFSEIRGANEVGEGCFERTLKEAKK